MNATVNLPNYRTNSSGHLVPLDAIKPLDLLRDDSEEARDWKGYDPFPGILTEADLDINAWTSRHRSNWSPRSAKRVLLRDWSCLAQLRPWRLFSFSKR